MKKKLLLFSLFLALAPLGVSAVDTTPTVTTSTRFARGATMAFVRMSATANGSIISERGICYATHPNPTVDDNTTKNTLSLNGTIYWLKDLEPSTRYYMRAYAKDRNGEVGYGDVRRFYTLPKATIHYTIRPDDANPEPIARITSAVEDAANYWTNLTSMQGFYPSVGYSPGTPTADCSYGGWVRVGSNVSYQRTGTILHEWLHGVGVGTTDTWYNNADMRTNVSRGDWNGERATEVIRFLANNNTDVLHGDNQHLWPYGINGAHEDNGQPSLYIANSLVCQALGEDGLPLTSQMGFATPYQAFDEEDTVKYYFKSEDANHGLYSSFLKEEADGSLRWVSMATKTAKTNDSTAWKLKYNPVNCFYTIRNVATGHYITYGGTFRASNVTSTSSTAQLQLLRGRVEAVEGMSAHGYFIAYNNHTMQSPVLEADADGATGSGEFTFSNDATSRRWLILTADEAENVEKLGIANTGSSLEDVIKSLEALLDTPHVEDVEGTDAKLKSEIEAIRTAAAAATSAGDLEALEARAYDAATAFLPGVTASDEANPFDITFFLTNATVAKTDGWSDTPTLNYFSAEYFEKTFDFHQVINRDFPKGYYRVKTQAFQRPGSYASTYTAWNSKAETPAITTEIYVGLGTANNLKGTQVKNIWDDAQKTAVGTGNEVSEGGLYVPNDMHAASAYFDKGLYDNERQIRQYTNIKASAGLKVGIRCTSSEASYWTIFRNFRLYYIGSKVITGITAPETVKTPASSDVYSISGQLVRHGSDLNGLPSGLYIVGGKKVVVR